MEEKALKVAVVGAGGMGTVHISNYAHIEGCKVVAVCDAAESGRAKAAEFGIKAYAGIGELLASEDVDVVDICTPTFTHVENAMAALEAGKHVICEKPAALAKADAKMMFDKAREKGVRIFIGQVLQYAPETIVLRGLVDSGEYGKVLDAQFLRLSARPRWITNGWMFDKAKSGLLPFDLHIHDLDLIISLFGEPKTFSYTSCGNEGVGFKEHYRFLYGYKGLNVVAEAAWYNADIPFTATWRVYFENAVVICDGGGVVAYQFDKEPRVFDTEEKIKIPTGINLPPTGMFYAELSDFLSQIRAGGSGCVREAEILAVLGILEQIGE